MHISAFVRGTAVTMALAAAAPAFAASSEFVNKAAHVLALFIIIAVPIGGIVLFWLVHILPEKVAEKRHHPQKDAIQVLCLLSLVFGGLLWPIAWLWAYSKPVLHKMAYGRDKHDDYYAAADRVAAEGAAANSTAPDLREELGRLRRELEDLERRGELTDAMRGIRERLTTLERQAAPHPAAGDV